MQILSRFQDRTQGFVQLSLIDATTGKVLQAEKRKTVTTSLGYEIVAEAFKKLKLVSIKDIEEAYNKFRPNMSVTNARLVAARLLGGYSQFKAEKIEWGWGSTPAQKSDTDISQPFLPRVRTSIVSREFPKDNILKVTSILSSETLTFPSPGPVGATYPFVREVGLKTDILTDPITNQAHPNGILIARYVNDVDYPKTSSNVNIGLQWLYIYN